MNMELELWCIFVTVVFCTLLCLLFVWKSSGFQVSKKRVTHRMSVRGSSVCKYPMCVRCQSRGYDAKVIKSELMECFNRAYTFDIMSRDLGRILSIIDSIDRKSEILQNLYIESGFTLEDTYNLQPHVWWMPNLKRSQFWETSDSTDLEKIVLLFESKATIQLLLNEYTNVCTKPLLWKENDIPRGKWSIFPFYDQGCKIKETCDVCPNTVRLLESVSSFMKGCVYGNAMISVLESGSQIEAHTGPCNFRLRCHLPLFSNGNYKIQVGREVKGWEEGKLMIFDDSFVHRVWYDHAENVTSKRIVLIFDVWHPDINEDERQALNLLFSSN